MRNFFSKVGLSITLIWQHFLVNHRAAQYVRAWSDRNADSTTPALSGISSINAKIVLVIIVPAWLSRVVEAVTERSKGYHE